MLQLAFDKGCTDQSYEDRSRNVFSTAYVRRPIPAASAFRFHSGEVYRTHEYFIDGVRVRPRRTGEVAPSLTLDELQNVCIDDIRMGRH